MSARILIIDDDARLAEMLRTYLAARGYACEVRGDGRGGLRALEADGPEGPFDAVVLDVMLPDTDGFEICRRVRARSDVPIVMLTARGDATDRVVGLELGADDYLPKPFDPRELLARLGAVLRRTRRPGPTAEAEAEAGRGVMRFGPLSIDRRAREVRVAGDRRELTARQFDLLVLLAERAGRVQTREQIMDALRGEEWDSVDRSIDVHVSRIRTAIEEDPRHPRFLQTVRGAGYVFALPQPDGAGGDGGAP
jgi:two-component system, OmpR family, phosphate regulon response regulator OmpR